MRTCIRSAAHPPTYVVIAEKKSPAGSDPAAFTTCASPKAWITVQTTNA